MIQFKLGINIFTNNVMVEVWHNGKFVMSIDGAGDEIGICSKYIEKFYECNHSDSLMTTAERIIPGSHPELVRQIIVKLKK